MPLNLSLKPTPVSNVASLNNGAKHPTTTTTKLSIDLQPHNHQNNNLHNHAHSHHQASPGGIWSPASALEEEEQRRQIQNYILTSHFLNAQQSHTHISQSQSPILQKSLQILPKDIHPLDALISTSIITSNSKNNSKKNGVTKTTDHTLLLATASADSASSSVSSSTTEVKTKKTKKSQNSPRTFQVRYFMTFTFLFIKERKSI
jgi:hypothetical protein